MDMMHNSHLISLSLSLLSLSRSLSLYGLPYFTHSSVTQHTCCDLSGFSVMLIQ